jgi:hypothetical protein
MLLLQNGSHFFLELPWDGSQVKFSRFSSSSSSDL